MKQVFISYRREDVKDIAKRIGEGLSKCLGKRRIFIDVDGIRPAHDFRKTILRSLEKTGLLLVVIGPKWLECAGKDGQRRLDSADDYVRVEIENAILRDIPMLPLLVDGTTMPAPDDLPPSLRNLAYRNAVPICDDQDFDETIRSLVSVIRGLASSSRRKILALIASAAAIAASATVVGFFIGKHVTRPPVRPYGDSDRAFLRKDSDGHRHYVHQAGSIDFFNDPKYLKNESYRSIPLTLGRGNIDDSASLYNLMTLSAHNPLSDLDGDNPLFVWDILPSHHFELKYLKDGGGSSKSDMFVMGAPRFRPHGEGNELLTPTVEKAMIATGVDGGIRVESRSHFGTAADVACVRTYAIPTKGETTANLSVEFRAEEDIELGPRGPKSDSFRFLTITSRYEDDTDYDSNVILSGNRAGGLQQLRLDDPQWKLNVPERNNVHLFKEVRDQFRNFGTWFELVKEPGSTRMPDGPSIRVDVVDSGGLDLGIQGFLWRAKGPDGLTDRRTLDVWIEWLDAPSTIVANTTIKVAFKITASPPRRIALDTPVASRKPSKDDR